MSLSSTGKKYKSVVIRNVNIINGRGTPAYGPADILIEDEKIKEIVGVTPGALKRSGFKRPEAEYEINAKGMYAIPGLVDMHVHVPFRETQCGPKSAEYCYKLFLAHGVTTIRTCGFGTDDKLIKHRKMSKENKLPAPRIVILGTTGNILTPEEGKTKVRELHEKGCDGIKMIPRTNINEDVLRAMGEEVKALDMKAGIAMHIPQNSELDAVSASEAVGEYLTIEHTYGIPQAAIPGSQNLPAEYNYSNEVDRFRLSGHIWTEAAKYPENVEAVLDLMIANGTAWNPTMVVYEINREYELCSRWKWLDKYTTPALLKGWSPNPASHATYHYNWKTSDEVAWKEKYRIWMYYLKMFRDRGGIITAGSDCGFMYTLYGFGLIRELELLQEAGFHSLDVIKMASTNAKILNGQDEIVGGIQVGFNSDIAIVDGNPQENFKILYGTGVPKYNDDKTAMVPGGGVIWTIKDGIVFDAKELLEDVADYVASLKESS